jgi:predicted ABC-type transport system involved in lysophospholipase L1 biosynthesis ATPase subunit
MAGAPGSQPRHRLHLPEFQPDWRLRRGAIDALTYRGIEAAERKTYADALENWDVGRAKHLRQLSGGQQQRVAMARRWSAAAHPPRRQATGNLDSRNGEAVMNCCTTCTAGATICGDSRPRFPADDRTVHLFDGQIVDE